ncbi:MAG: FAD:protein FMN transferase [bacterium]|nr:FAD:protein FMN transferase [bacterium]
MIEIKVLDKNKAHAQEAIEATIEEMKRIVSLMNIYDKKSEISLINKNGKKGTIVSKELLEVINEAIRFSKLTKGAFDITISPIFKCWNFGSKNPQLPDKNIIEEAKKRAGYQNIKIIQKEKKVVLEKGTVLDLGGIAKGYVVKKACDKLKKMGINSALVNAGGDIQVIGNNFGFPWKIGIQDPRHKKKIRKVIKIIDKAVATSGDYEKYFILEGKRYHHILNPHTGYPAKKCISVTIIATTAFVADILATGVFALGPEEGLRLVESLEGIECYIITANKEYTSSGFSNYVK